MTVVQAALAHHRRHHPWWQHEMLLRTATPTLQVKALPQTTSHASGWPSGCRVPSPLHRAQGQASQPRGCTQLYSWTRHTHHCRTAQPMRDEHKLAGAAQEGRQQRQGRGARRRGQTWLPDHGPLQGGVPWCIHTCGMCTLLQHMCVATFCPLAPAASMLALVRTAPLSRPLATPPAATWGPCPGLRPTPPTRHTACVNASTPSSTLLQSSALWSDHHTCSQPGCCSGLVCLPRHAACEAPAPSPALSDGNTALQDKLLSCCHNGLHAGMGSWCHFQSQGWLVPNGFAPQTPQHGCCCQQQAVADVSSKC